MKIDLKTPKISCGACVNEIANTVKTLNANAIVQGIQPLKLCRWKPKLLKPQSESNRQSWLSH